VHHSLSVSEEERIQLPLACTPLGRSHACAMERLDLVGGRLKETTLPTC
jgi:hypothetical protein